MYKRLVCNLRTSFFTASGQALWMVLKGRQTPRTLKVRYGVPYLSRLDDRPGFLVVVKRPPREREIRSRSHLIMILIIVVVVVVVVIVLLLLLHL